MAIWEYNVGRGDNIEKKKRGQESRKKWGG